MFVTNETNEKVINKGSINHFIHNKGKDRKNSDNGAELSIS